jgi:hypothetical protein
MLQIGAYPPTELFPLSQACASIQELRTYWELARPSLKRLPGRQHIDPLDIRALLPGVWLVDVVRPRTGGFLRFRMRLQGTAIYDFVGHDSTGRFLDEIFENFEVTQSWRALKNAVLHHKISYLRHPHLSRFSDSHIDVEQIYLPIATDGENVDMVLGMNVYTQRE